jgi:AcrR family transcriptional regulator
MNMIRKTEMVESRRERKRHARVEQIVEAAMRLAVDEGLEALTIQRLARELDAAVGALYRYFPSKEALLAELQRRVIVAFRESLTQARQRLDAQLAGRTKRQADARTAALAAVLLPPWLYWTLAERAPAQFRMIRRMVGEPRDLLPDELAAPNVAVMLELLAEVGAVLDAAVQCSALEPGDTAVRTVLLWGSTDGLMQLGKLGRFDPELFRTQALCAEMMRGLLRGWGARPPEVEAALGLLERLGSGADGAGSV